MSGDGRVRVIGERDKRWVCSSGALLVGKLFIFNKFVSIKVWHRPGAYVQSSPLWLPGMLCTMMFLR